MQLIKKPFGGLALLALALSPLTSFGAQARYQFEPLNLPDNVGTPVAINNCGTILLGGSDGDPALVDGNSVKPFTIPRWRLPNPTALNSQGTIVGTASTEDFSSSFGFAITKRGKMTTLNVPGTLGTTPMGINNRDVVVGSVFTDDGLGQGFIWDTKGPRLFAFPGVDYTEFTGINDSGTAVGNYYFYGETNVDFGMFTLQGSKYTKLNIPNVMWPNAKGINNSGEIVGFYFPDIFTIHGFIYSRGVFTPVVYPFPSGDAPASFPPEPFDMGDGRSGTLTYVRTSIFTTVTGINDSGDIVGNADAFYTPTVNCDGCGLTSDDFPGKDVSESFTGERDGRCGLHLKLKGKPHTICLPHGESARDFIFGRRR